MAFTWDPQPSRSHGHLVSSLPLEARGSEPLRSGGFPKQGLPRTRSEVLQ